MFAMVAMHVDISYAVLSGKVYGQSGSPSLACSHANIPVSQRHRWSAGNMIEFYGYK